MSRRPVVVVLALALLVGHAHRAQASAVVVPVSYLDQVTKALVLNELRPDQCAAISIQNLAVRAATTTVSGTNENDLILGGPNLDTLNGLEGDDCIVGGAGIDTISGGPGTDVCIGGAGLDLFFGCETFIQ